MNTGQLNNIFKQCERGLSNAWLDMFQFCDDPHSKIHPEYLVTMALVRAFSEAQTGVIRIEQNTRQLMFHTRTSSSRRGYKLSRHGRIDVFVEGATKSGNLYVEIKRYATGFNTIKEDLERCTQLVMAGGHARDHIGSCCFLYRVDGAILYSALERKMQKRLMNLDKKLYAHCQAHKVTLTCRSFYLGSAGFDNDNEANELDEDGVPAHQYEESYLTHGVVILVNLGNPNDSMFSTEQSITDAGS